MAARQNQSKTQKSGADGGYITAGRGLQNGPHLAILLYMTDFLYARPSILEGVGRNMDFFGSMNQYNYSQSGDEADSLSIYADWLDVLKDFHVAYNNTICLLEAGKTAP